MASDDPTGDPAQAAERYASFGWAVVPIRPGGKHPPITGWQDAATTDLNIIRRWWTGPYRGHGVGLLCGVDFWVLDVDTAAGKPGALSLAELYRTHGPLPDTVCAITGSGGLHYLFAWDPGRPVSNGDAIHLGPGLDIRGTGGQIVVAPTVHPNGVRYQWMDGRDPWSVELAAAPGWLYELIHPPEAPTQPAQPAVGAPAGNGIVIDLPTAASDSDSIAAWIRSQHDWRTELEADGWTLHSTKPDGDTWWTRPGKNRSDGHSAVLHAPDGPLVVFTTEIPPELVHAGARTADGSAVSVSMFGYLAGMRHGGDRSALARSARHEQRTQADGSRRSRTSPPSGDDRDQNLPTSFWEARPMLTQIHDAAWARLLSPDAVLAAVLARLAASIPPAFQLPPIVGARSSVSFYAVLTGPPGTGKSTAISTASNLLSIQDKTIAEGGQLGTGEGLIELYMAMVEVDDGEGGTRNEKRQVRLGAFVTLDEGAALTEMGRRKGSTLLPILRSMWTGGPVGQANAAAETRRQLRAGTYTLGFLLGIQPARAAEFLADDAAGTPQRFVWARSTDPSIPATPTTWPGSLHWTPPVLSSKHPTSDFTLDQAISTEIRGNALARNRGEVVVDPLDAHRDLLRLKCAALLAALESRLDVTIEDWQLAGVMVDTSVKVRSDVIATVAFEREEHERANTWKAIGRERALEAERDKRAHEKYEQTLDSAARTAFVTAERAGRDGVTHNMINKALGGRRRQIVDVADVIDYAMGLQWLQTNGNDRFTIGKACPQ